MARAKARISRARGMGSLLTRMMVRAEIMKTGKVKTNSGAAEIKPRMKASERVLTERALKSRAWTVRREINNSVPEPLR